MVHENVDENATYLKACENVKKIVNAIKTIKMKYYTNFAKISQEDKKTYDELEKKLEIIAEENNLMNLKIALMEDVSARYDKNELINEPKNTNDIDERLKACYGNVDVQHKALLAGKIGQAKKCQDILEQYLNEIDIDKYRECVKNYKREKFAELVMERVAVQKKNEEYVEYMKTCFFNGTAETRKEVSKKIEEIKTNKVTLFDVHEKQHVNSRTELEPQIG